MMTRIEVIAYNFYSMVCDRVQEEIDEQDFNYGVGLHNATHANESDINTGIIIECFNKLVEEWGEEEFYEKYTEVKFLRHEIGLTEDEIERCRNYTG